jgi:NitT/TauT family transport system permease protein
MSTDALASAPPKIAAPTPAVRAKSESALMRFVVSTVVIVVLLLVWEAACLMGFVKVQILPPPHAVFLKFIESIKPQEAFDSSKMNYLQWLVSGELIHDAISSMGRVLVGFLIGGGLGLVLGLAMGASNLVYDLLNPLVQILRPIPPIAYIPLSILWFGLGNPPAYFLIALGAFFPVLINTIAGVRNVDSIYIRAAQNLGASQMTMFLRVIIPAAMPYILTGVKVGIGVAFIVVIVAEMIAVNNGLGYRITEAREFFWSDKIIVGMFTIGMLGLLLDILISKLNNHLLRWHRGMEH